MSYVITTSICQVGSIAQFYVRETKLRDLCHTSWRRSPLALPGSCRVGDPQTRGQLYQRSSHTVVKVLGPQQISQLGDPAKELRTPREFDFEGQWDLITELPRNWGNRDSWRTQTKPCEHQDLGERSSDTTREWARLACECPGVSSGGIGSSQGNWIQQPWEPLHSGSHFSPFEGHHY